MRVIRSDGEEFSDSTAVGGSSSLVTGGGGGHCERRRWRDRGEDEAECQDISHVTWRSCSLIIHNAIHSK